MNYSFKQIRSNKTTYEIADSATFMVSFTIIASFIFIGLVVLIDNKLSAFLIFPLIFSKLLIRRNLKDWPKKKDLIGQIKFKETELVFIKNVKSETINYDSINYIKLNSNYIKGKPYSGKDIQHNGLQKLKIRTNKKIYKVIFVIETEEEWQNLKLTLKNLYQSGITIKEFLFNRELKSILLNPDWSYEEIQELKKELGVNDFYA